MNRFFLATLVACLSTSTQVNAFTPEQAMSVLYEKLRGTLGFSGESKKNWLSLSMVGSLVDSSDLSQVNDLANFCPDTQPVIQSFQRARKIDLIYEKLLNSLTGPLRPEPQDVKDAQDRLRTRTSPPAETPEYSVWKSYQKSYSTKFGDLFTSKTPAERAQKQNELLQIDKDWKVLGYKSYIAEAFNVINANDIKYGAIKQENRRDVLSYYRLSGLAPSDTPGAFKAPASEVSPTVDKWDDVAGWSKFLYTSKSTSTDFNQSTSNARGFGGLNLGFITIVGGGGSGSGSTSKVTNVDQFDYSFELKRVTIRRPWLDTEVFFEPAGWTWRKSPNTAQFPYVSAYVDSNGKPAAPTEVVYDNKPIDCAMLPLELVIARNRSLTTTTTKQTYDETVSTGSVSGGGGFFGIFGGHGGKDWSSIKISETGNDVTFKIDAPGIAVIGIISEVIPVLPEPNLHDTWPDNAWINKK
ncbi:hypothetical protein [Methylocystis sp. Sn-Cys]|uniref:hypothetical protein n=1 Tax=Methylocystis sp. Sn-Cys TaxID=1701263 RepID=UPI001923D122|nr:hypothetical protein [Methylocystis sp. Sn-Cys]MBL1255963.1 hypothetical protein [Methylocystis sp. Sn-Cys]